MSVASIELLWKVHARKAQATEALVRASHVARFQAQVTGSSASRALLETAFGALRRFKVEHSSAYDPFELFWGNPDEPSHSRLLAYFINPCSEHGCGLYLLRLFLKTLDVIDPNLPVDEECDVICEKGHIDLLISRDREDGKYALIIENKVNGARDQESQLQRYYSHVCGRFENHQVYVCYLPLRSGNPSANSIGSIPKERLQTKSFKDHVIPWLLLVLGDQANWPTGLAGSMRDNLKHYLDLLMWRLNTERIMQMKETIFEALSLAEREKSLPSLEEITSLRESAQELEGCYRRLMRVKTLSAVRRLLEERHKLKFASEWRDGADDLHSTEYVYSYRVDELVHVGLGEDKDGVFLGYNAAQTKGELKRSFEEFVRKEAPSMFVGKRNEYWYAWHYVGEAIQPEDVALITSKAVTMYEQMQQLVAKFRAGKQKEQPVTS